MCCRSENHLAISEQFGSHGSGSGLCLLLHRWSRQLLLGLPRACFPGSRKDGISQTALKWSPSAQDLQWPHFTAPPRLQESPRQPPLFPIALPGSAGLPPPSTRLPGFWPSCHPSPFLPLQSAGLTPTPSSLLFQSGGLIPPSPPSFPASSLQGPLPHLSSQHCIRTSSILLLLNLFPLFMALCPSHVTCLFFIFLLWSFSSACAGICCKILYSQWLKQSQEVQNTAET